MGCREYDIISSDLLNNQPQVRGLVFSIYIYVGIIPSNMAQKETVKADKMCSQALAYFYVMAQIRTREHSFEMLCSRGHETNWSLNEDNWCKFVAFPVDDFEIKN